MSAVLFDEPLTVIDPALKWELRSKLKAVHRALDMLMIYVTHDQTEGADVPAPISLAVLSANGWS